MKVAARAAAVLAALAMVLVTLGVVGLRAFGGGDDDHHPAASTTTVPAPAPTIAPPTTGAPPVPIDPAPAARATLGPVVRLAPPDEDESRFPTSPDAVGGLVPGTVLQVRVSGFDGPGAARAEQCLVQAISARCGNRIPVQIAEDGTAAFQYLVGTSFVAADTEPCRVGASRCSLVVEDVDGNDRAEVQTIFHDQLPPPGRVTVTPDDDLVDGSTVTIALRDYPPAAVAQALLCAAPATAGTERCAVLADGATIPVGPDGTATATISITARRVGTDGVACGRGRRCGISVMSTALAVPTPVVPIGFAAPPGADYDAGRLAAGLAAAAVLLGIVLWLVRRTDWRPLGEEAAPEIDAADYADLDAIVAALPPEDDPDDQLTGAARR